jgi:putative oxidoreductase
MKRENGVRDLAVFITRGIVGAGLAAHGAQKLFGWFNGPGITGASGFMQSLGFTPGERYARAASATELAAGTLIALGALGPIGPAMLAAVMTTAVGSVHLPKGFFTSEGGYELNTMYGLLGLMLAVDDYGRLSVDQIAGLRGKLPAWASLITFAGGIGAGVAMLRQRRTEEKPPEIELGQVEAGSAPVNSTYAPGM